MEMFRTFLGFVMGLVVMSVIYFTGALDGVPHWWSRNVTHRIAKAVDDDPEHARYTISTVYQPGDDAQNSCEPQYQFINHTKRTVTFLPDGDDDGGYGDPAVPGSVSMSPQQTGEGLPPNGTHQNYGQRDDRRKNDDSQDYDSRSYGNGDQGENQYDDDYPGQSQGGCNAGVIQIILDRKK